MAASSQLVRALAEGRGFPHPVAGVRVVETHISWVLLTGTLAYKIKKPLDLGFLDFSTLEQRRHACEEELRLNRRLAPDLYLGVLPITGTPEDPRIGGPGTPIEFAVQMRQFPDDALLSACVRSRCVSADQFETFGEQLAQFHAGLVPATDPRAGTPESVAAPVRESLTQIERLLREEQPALRAVFNARLGAAGPLLEARRRQGFVRECHGDLHLGNLILADGRITAFDALEFDPALRWIDVMSEVMFPWMDLQVRRETALASAFLNGYLDRSGDFAGVALLPLFAGDRALVRAKVRCLRPTAAADPGEPPLATLLDFAREPLGSLRPALVLTTGPSGSGKTWLARRLSRALGAIHLRSDVERKRLAGLDARARSGSATGAGLYGPRETAATYRRLRALAADILSAGLPVIVDASHLTARSRAGTLALARSAGVPGVVLHCHGDIALLRDRVARRLAERRDPSEADLDVLDFQLGTFEPPVPGEATLVIDAAGGCQPAVEAMVETSAEAIRAAASQS